MTYSDQEYINADPFFGDESDLRCRSVAIRKARKQHQCFGIDGKQDHTIEPGERYRYERALVDGDFWGEYRICLKCMDSFLSEPNDDDDD